MYFNQLMLAAHKVHVVYFNQLLGAAHYIHFISNHHTLTNIYQKGVGYGVGLNSHSMSWGNSGGHVKEEKMSK